MQNGNSDLPATIAYSHPIVDERPVSATAIQAQINQIQEVMRQAMKEGVHYGRIPGCGDKPGLFKAGAEKIALCFRLRPMVDDKKEIALESGHREYAITMGLYDMRGVRLGQGIGVCSTMESKYRYRGGERKCPNCGKPTIIKGKAEYGGGWICFAKKGGCGGKFAEGDKSIEGQNIGRIENPDLADQFNTVAKMAKKRAMVDAVLSCTAASDIFTQDIEDIGDFQYLDEKGETKGGVVMTAEGKKVEVPPKRPMRRDEDPEPPPSDYGEIVDHEIVCFAYDLGKILDEKKRGDAVNWIMKQPDVAEDTSRKNVWLSAHRLPKLNSFQVEA